MNRIYKAISFLFLGFILAYITMKLESNFVENFSNNLLTLLTTLFAINIASSTLIAGKLREIQDKTGHPFPKTKESLKFSFYEQIVFIGLAFIFSMLQESTFLKNQFEEVHLNLVCNSILFFCFIYYLDIIRDIGKSLFDLLEFDNNDK